MDDKQMVAAQDNPSRTANMNRNNGFKSIEILVSKRLENGNFEGLESKQGQYLNGEKLTKMFERDTDFGVGKSHAGHSVNMVRGKAKDSGEEYILAQGQTTQEQKMIKEYWQNWYFFEEGKDFRSAEETDKYWGIDILFELNDGPVVRAATQMPDGKLAFGGTDDIDTSVLGNVKRIILVYHSIRLDVDSYVVQTSNVNGNATYSQEVKDIHNLKIEPERQGRMPVIYGNELVIGNDTVDKMLTEFVKSMRMNKGLFSKSVEEQLKIFKLPIQYYAKKIGVDFWLNGGVPKTPKHYQFDARSPQAMGLAQKMAQKETFVDVGDFDNARFFAQTIGADFYSRKKTFEKDDEERDDTRKGDIKLRNKQFAKELAAYFEGVKARNGEQNVNKNLVKEAIANTSKNDSGNFARNHASTAISLKNISPLEERVAADAKSQVRRGTEIAFGDKIEMKARSGINSSVQNISSAQEQNITESDMQVNANGQNIDAWAQNDFGKTDKVNSDIFDSNLIVDMQTNEKQMQNGRIDYFDAKNSDEYNEKTKTKERTASLIKIKTKKKNRVAILVANNAKMIGINAKNCENADSKPKIKAIIFDLDGVLSDSESAHLKTFNEVFAKFGIKISERYWLANYTGRGSEFIVKDIIARFGLNGADAKKIMCQRAELFEKIAKKGEVKPVKGALQIVKWAKKNKLKAIVASGGHKKHIAHQLESIGLSTMKFLGMEDVKKRKPDPEVFLKAAKMIGVAPEECLVIEDSTAGLKAAKSAGMRCLFIGKHHPKKQRKTADKWASAIASKEAKEFLNQLICTKTA
ncbi:MAG: HAD family phosphatase [Candidatus Micrarchaeia archaeon]